MWQRIKETVYRWRTWIVNGFFAIVLVLPDLFLALLGFSWDTIVPKDYMPWVTLFILVVNVWMRPRPAVLPNDPEAKVSKALDELGIR